MSRLGLSVHGGDVQMTRYRPTVSAKRVARLAEAQGLRLHRAQHRGVVRWVLCRADWVDHKQYLTYSSLRRAWEGLTDDTV